jgi:hypothetical protein
LVAEEEAIVVIIGSSIAHGHVWVDFFISKFAILPSDCSNYDSLAILAYQFVARDVDGVF